ncbi:MAG TPA: SH3 domain-containing protein [Candidatus Luteococcus avicola]|nr:SH3 domain-containing protein [Candidatus Luteococcus avicola]
MSLTRRTVLTSALAVGGLVVAEFAAPTTAQATTATKTAKATAITLGSVFVRSGAGTKFRAVKVLRKGQKVTLTGKTSGKWMQVTTAGTSGWISSRYLKLQTSAASSKTTSSANTAAAVAPKVVQGIPAGAIAVATTLPLASHVAMPGGVVRNGRLVAQEVRAKFPWITTMLGARASYGSDHYSGRAVDIMIPAYKRNAALGQAIAEHLRANASRLGITYVIWNQHIWSVQRSGEGWRKMPNRGSDNANHKNHVHVSVR